MLRAVFVKTARKTLFCSMRLVQLLPRKGMNRKWKPRSMYSG
jgi:hypothetical protein